MDNRKTDTKNTGAEKGKGTFREVGKIAEGIPKEFKHPNYPGVMMSGFLDEAHYKKSLGGTERMGLMEMVRKAGEESHPGATGAKRRVWTDEDSDMLRAKSLIKGVPGPRYGRQVLENAGISSDVIATTLRTTFPEEVAEMEAKDMAKAIEESKKEMEMTQKDVKGKGKEVLSKEDKSKVEGEGGARGPLSKEYVVDSDSDDTMMPDTPRPNAMEENDRLIALRLQEEMDFEYAREMAEK